MSSNLQIVLHFLVQVLRARLASCEIKFCFNWLFNYSECHQLWQWIYHMSNRTSDWWQAAVISLLWCWDSYLYLYIYILHYIYIFIYTYITTTSLTSLSAATFNLILRCLLLYTVYSYFPPLISISLNLFLSFSSRAVKVHTNTIEKLLQLITFTQIQRRLQNSGRILCFFAKHRL